MPYYSVLNLIDAELGRLHAARRLLLDEPEKPGRVLAMNAQDEPGGRESSASDTPPAAAPQTQVREVVVQRIAARIPRRSSGAPRKRRNSGEISEPGALSGSIPSAPVAVSAAAAAVRSRELVSREETRKPEPETVTGEGTLDALLKDLRSRGSAA